MAQGAGILMFSPAFYFAWLGFYTTWLIVPTIIGLIVFFYGVGTAADRKVCVLHVLLSASPLALGRRGYLLLDLGDVPSVRDLCPLVSQNHLHAIQGA
jgi:hypothetical protein